MLTLRKSDERGMADHGWLVTKHSFSFGDYYDPQHMGFRHLRVINQDIVQPGTGFPTHPHRNMEIITYVIRGAVKHTDTLNNQAIISAGEVQAMSAGTGVYHSEYNPSSDEPLELLQIWIVPDRQGYAPRYSQRAVFSKKNQSKKNRSEKNRSEKNSSEKNQSDPDKTDQLKLIVSKDGRNQSLPIYQDISLYASVLQDNQDLTYELKPDRHAWVQLISGQLNVEDFHLQPGDGLAISEINRLNLKAVKKSEFLFFDLA